MIKNNKKQTLAIHTCRNGDEESHANRSDPDIIIIKNRWHFNLCVLDSSTKWKHSVQTNAENSLPKEVCITLLTQKHIINNNEGFILLCFWYTVY